MRHQSLSSLLSGSSADRLSAIPAEEPLPHPGIRPVPQISTLRLRPALARITRRLSRRSLTDLAEESRILHPGEQRRLPPAIALPCEFDRVLGFDATTCRGQQQIWLNNTVEDSLPTRAFLLRDVLMTPAGVFHRRSHAPLKPGAPRGPLRGPLPRFSEALLCSSPETETYFGHWLDDALPLELLAQDCGLPIASPARAPWLHEAGYRRLTGLTGPQPVTAGWYDRLWIIDDRGLNSGRIARMQRLRQRVLAARPPLAEAGSASGFQGNRMAGRGTRLFLRRGLRGAARRLRNESEVIARLAGRGFQAISPEEMSPEALAAALAGAEIVAGVEGSALCHSHLALPAGAALLVIQPPFRFNAMARPYAAALGHHYAYTVAEPSEAGFLQPAERLLATLEILEARMAQAAPITAPIAAPIPALVPAPVQTDISGSVTGNSAGFSSRPMELVR